MKHTHQPVTGWYPPICACGNAVAREAAPLTDTLRAAHRVGVWEERYRTGTLPAEDNHADLFATQRPGFPVALRLEQWVAEQWRKQA